MVGKPEPVALAIREARRTLPNARVISLAPSGRRLRQRDLKIFAQLGSLIFLCGRYEGIDQRVVDTLCDDEISLGDFVLMGGELAALAVIEGTTRLIPGALGNTDSLSQESFSDNVLVEAPQYTRPEEFEGSRVPEILLSGNHSHIAQWRTEQAIAKSTQRLHEELQALRERTSALRKLKKSVGA
jgi:tRNA (guanine37-N1)-methyltransferase